jgi:hypothetical protein
LLNRSGSATRRVGFDLDAEGLDGDQIRCFEPVGVADGREVLKPASGEFVAGFAVEVSEDVTLDLSASIREPLGKVEGESLHAVILPYPALAALRAKAFSSCASADMNPGGLGFVAINREMQRSTPQCESN